MANNHQKQTVAIHWFLSSIFLTRDYSKIYMIQQDKIKSLDDACKKVLETPKIRFAGVLDKMGNRIAGGFKEGLSSYLLGPDSRRMYIQLTLEFLMRKDFDKELGAIDYIASRRGKVTMISIPTKDYLVLISAQRDVNVEEIISTVNSAFTMLPDIKP